MSIVSPARRKEHNRAFSPIVPLTIKLVHRYRTIIWDINYIRAHTRFHLLYLVREGVFIDFGVHSPRITPLGVLSRLGIKIDMASLP